MMDDLYTCNDGTRIKVINNGGFPVLTVSKMPEGSKFYSELGSEIAQSPTIKREALTMKKLLGMEEEENEEENLKGIGKFFASMQKDWQATQVRRFSGEQKSFVLYTALSDDSKFSLRACFPGSLFVYDLSKSDLIAVSGSFFAANYSAKYDVFSTKDVNIRTFSETKDLFQHFHGSGYVVLEVHGAFVEVPLYAGEKIQVAPGQLLAVTQQKIGEDEKLTTEKQTVKMQMISAGDVTLRQLENRDYFLELTAPGEISTDPNQPVVATVWLASVKHDDFFRKFKRNLIAEVKDMIKKQSK